MTSLPEWKSCKMLQLAAELHANPQTKNLPVAAGGSESKAKAKPTQIRAPGGEGLGRGSSHPAWDNPKPPALTLPKGYWGFLAAQPCPAVRQMWPHHPTAKNLSLMSHRTLPSVSLRPLLSLQTLVNDLSIFLVLPSGPGRP